MSAPPAIAVAGAGAFGTALAVVMARGTQHDVVLYGRDRARVAEMEKIRRNARSLPDTLLPDGIAVSADCRHLGEADIVLFAMPSQGQRAAARALGSSLKAGASVVVCAKGLEKPEGRFLTDVLTDELAGAHPIAVLSGPGFASDIAAGLPTAMTLASDRMSDAEALATVLSQPTFRLYAADDPVGVQIGGALKNVLAIACGIVEGAGLGESARAALIARGLAELTRFAVALGGRRETTAGLSGLGDLVLTATSRKSRNLRFGIALGRGETAASLLKPGASLTEGAYTASLASCLARERNVAMPITDAVSDIIDGRTTVEASLAALMARPLTSESP